MTNEAKDLKEPAAKAETPKPKATEKVVRTVTSDCDVDFPSLNWSISKGTVRALPEDEQVAAHILLNHHITLTTN